MADGDALHVTRTKAFSAVGVQKTLEKGLISIIFPVFLQNTGQAAGLSGFEEHWKADG